MKNVLISLLITTLKIATTCSPLTGSIFQDNTVIQREQHFLSLILTFLKKEQIHQLNQVFLSAYIFMYD